MRLIPILLLVCAATGHSQLKLVDRPMWVFPGQTFRIAIEQPPGSGQLACRCPESLDCFDSWDKDAIQRFYFRALESGDAEIHFSGAGGELSLTVSVVPWSSVYEPREFEGIQLPRLWPLGEADYNLLKQERTLHSEAEIERLRESNKPAGPIATRWLDLPDAEVFDVVPGPCVPRTCLIVLNSAEEARGKGCPVCGTAIYEGRSGFYPWIFDAEEHPWKVGCPECGTWFPSNDFQHGDMHSGDFPDDGFGCEPVTPVTSENGTPWRFPFIAYYHEWEAYMRTLTPGITQSAEAYVTTGDARYAHKAAIGLFRWAESMLDMSVNLNHRKMAVRDAILRGPVGAPDMNRAKRLAGSFTYIQPNWDTPRMVEMAEAYDLILPAIDDGDVLAFIQSRSHPEIETADDLRRFVEAGIHRASAQAAMDNAVARNWPQQETMLTTMALAMDTPRALEIVDWLLNEGAGIRYSLTNQYFKDGSGHESEGYNGIQIRDMAELVLLLDRIAQRYPDDYREPRLVSLAHDPKFRQIFLFPLLDSLIGRTYPSTGDTGGAGVPDVIPPSQGYPLSPPSFADIYRLTRDPRFAQALHGPSGALPGTLAPEFADEIRAVTEERGWQVATESDILDGYGHAVLRSGEGDRQRALWMRYGRVTQHAHPDMLSIGFEALRRKLLPEMGYPVGWTYARNWETNWGTHYVTHIAGHATGDFGRGEVTLFADAAPIHVASARTETLTGDEPRPSREKTIVLVDIDERDCYAVVLEDVSGGGKHYWSFHGPDGEATPGGVTLQHQGGGTMLGPDAAYRDDSSVADTDRELSCFAFMQDVSRGEVAGPWSLDCLARNQGDVHLRMTSVYPLDGSVATAIGRAPGGKSNYEITWAIVERSGEAPLESRFLTVLEPYEGPRRVTSIEPLDVSGEALAVRVSGEGFTDTILLGSGEADGVRSDGAVGFWREQDGAPPTMALVAGSELARGDLGVRLAVPRLTGTITDCDWGARRVTVNFAPGDQQVTVTAPDDGPQVLAMEMAGLSADSAAALAGRHLRIKSPTGTDASYLVDSAEWAGGQVVLTFHTDPRIGEGFVQSVEGNVANSGVTMGLYRWGYYRGKTISNEDGSVLRKLVDVENGRACQLAGDAPADFADVDGDGTANFVIYDYGPGDEVEIPCWVTVKPAG